MIYWLTAKEKGWRAVDISCSSGRRGGGMPGQSQALGSRCSVAVTLSKRELIQAIRQFAAQRGCRLPQGTDRLEMVCGRLSLTVQHDEDDWQPLHYCVED
ncbi:MAG: hypothetical protein IT445_16070 [Phycisphaeraceae bacterium]|nr:hypothetical protein [Phycisphaeraceae bacterium]